MRMFSAAIWVAASPVLAETTLPRYDIAALCQREALPAGGFATAIYNRCIDAEQAAYDGLLSRLGQVSQSDVAFCAAYSPDEVAGFSRLERCLTLLKENAAPRKEFRY